MIIPSALMGVTDYVYVAGVAANPDSITAVLYRWVGATRSGSGITVTVTAVGSGEYKFTWTVDAGFARTDELELVALPVVSGVTYPATVWRSHGGVDAVMRGTDGAMLAASYTAPDNASITAIKSKTDNLPSDPADQSIIVAATDAILTAVGTRLSTAGYTAPDNASITAIKDGIGWTLASLYGACANPQAADALVQLTINGYAYSGQYAGLTSTGVRTAPTLSKV
jgi:hypothetical protein